MTRRSVLSLLVPLVLVGGLGASASASGSKASPAVGTKTTDVCLLVWNDPTTTGRDGVCVRLPNLPV